MPSQNHKDLNREHVEAMTVLFEELEAYYMYDWNRNFADEYNYQQALLRWTEELQRYPVKAIRKAMREWCNHNISKPPKLGEIKSLIKRQGPWLGASTQIPHEIPALDWRPGDGKKRTVNEWRDHIRQQVGLAPIHTAKDDDHATHSA